MALMIKDSHLRTIVVNMEHPAFDRGLAQQLANALGGPCYALPELKADALVKTVKRELGSGGEERRGEGRRGVGERGDRVTGMIRVTEYASRITYHASRITQRGSRQLLADAALLGVTAIWGATFVMVKDAVASFPVFSFMALRFVFAALVLLPFVCLRRRGRGAEGQRSGGVEERDVPARSLSVSPILPFSLLSLAPCSSASRSSPVTPSRPPACT